MSSSEESVSCLGRRWGTYRATLKEQIFREEMRAYAHHIHGKYVGSDKDENTILEQEFFQLLGLIDDYLEPITGELAYSVRKLLDLEGSGAQEQTEVPSRTLILLADPILLDLPLEGLTWLRGKNEVIFTSVARDLSMNLFHSRLHGIDGAEMTLLPKKSNSKDSMKGKGKKQTPRDDSATKNKNKHNSDKDKTQKKPEKKGGQVSHSSSVVKISPSNFKYLIDPYGDAALSDSDPTEVLRSFQSANGKLAASQWKGFAGNSETVCPPSPGDMETLLLKDGSNILFLFEKFSEFLSPSKIITANLSGCQLMLILDRCQSGLSHNRKLKAADKARCRSKVSTPDDPVTVALLLSLSGVTSVVQTQWNSSPMENSRRFEQILSDLFVKNYPVGKAVMLAMSPLQRLTSQEEVQDGKNATEKESTTTKKAKPSDDRDKRARRKSSEKSKSQSRESQGQKTIEPNFGRKNDLILKRSMFNVICYGLPELLVGNDKK